MPKQKICLLSLSVSVSCLVLMLVIVFWLFVEKKQKIIVEIDLIIKDYESTDLDKIVTSQKEQKTNMNGTNIT